MKKLTLKVFIFIIVTAGALLTTVPAFAQSIPNYLKANSFSDLIAQIISFASSLVTPVVVLVSLYAAFVILTAAGEPKKITKGKQALTWTMVGLAIILVSNGLLGIVRSTASAGDVKTLIGQIITYMRNIGGPIAIVMYLYGSFLFVSGNPKSAEKGMKVLLWTSVAVAIIMVATSIEGIVKYFLKG